MTPTLEALVEELATVGFGGCCCAVLPLALRPCAWCSHKVKLLAALEAAKAEGARQALREAAQRMDTSDHDPWARVEIRDWLLWQAGQDGG